MNVTLGIDGSGTTLDGTDADPNTVGIQQGTDTFTGIEGVRGSAFDDTLTGSDRLDVVERFEGLAGNDTITGNDGQDRVEYGQSQSGVNVNLVDEMASDDGLGGTDTLIGIEQVTGSRFNDTITGDGNANLLAGGEGNDILVGGGGADIFDWNAGDEGTSGSPAVDTVADFNATLTPGTDALNLEDILVGEETNPLTDYLHFTSTNAGADTTVEIQSAGAGGVDQQIVLQGVTYASLGTDDANIISNLLTNGKLIVDVV